MTIAEFHKKFEEEVANNPDYSFKLTQKEKKIKDFCSHLVPLDDGTYSCIWSIHGPACTICYKLYPRNYT